jgi:hypothetical protein
MTMNHKFAEQLVSDFWERAGYEEPFPRQLERPIMSTTPVFVVKVHRQRLDATYIRNQLQRRGVNLPTPWADRRLNGCLVAFKGEAAIFVDGTLRSDEGRVIIAHEFGHFLADYEWPRFRALRHLGDAILEVLDGARPPTANERLAAALTDVQIGVYVHYLDRSRNSDVAFLVDEVEETARIVGAELLAPRQTVLAEMAQHGDGYTSAAIVQLLKKRFGLPTTYAGWYADRLERHCRKRRSFCDVLGLKKEPRG